MSVATGGPATTADSAATSAAAERPDPAEIIAAHVEAAGGEEALAAVKSLRLVAELDTGAQQITATSEHVWSADGRFLQHEKIPGFGEAWLGFDGERVWADDPINGPRTLEGVELAQAQWAADPFHWWRWEKFHPEATYLEQATTGGRRVHRVELQTRPGAGDTETVVAAFDAETGLLDSVSFVQVAPTGSIPLTVKFADYTQEGPMRIAHRQVAKLPLGEFSQRYTEIEVNADIEDGDFRPPNSP